MSDRELLEFAAKAAGIHVPTKKDYPWAYIDESGIFRDISCAGDGTRMSRWNPLTDDGDAFRLMVKLGETGFFRLNFGAGAVSAENPAVKPLPILYACEDMEELGGAAATRRAIVRAAAEIGRQMP